jgi:uncharacterized membrane protein YjjP (DUF1212 family)
VTAEQGTVRYDAEIVETLMLNVGAVLLACGEAVTDVQDLLELVAERYGYPEAQVSVMPTVMHVAAEREGRTRLGKPMRLLDTRLDQAAAAIRISNAIVRGELEPREAKRHLDEVINEPHRFSRRVMVAGHVLLTVGLALILQPTKDAVFLAVLFGLMVGIFKVAGYGMRIRPGFLLPVVSAASVSALAFVLLDHDPPAQSIGALIPPLITFLPGGLLTMALYDLAAGEVVAGASQFVAGLLQLLMLGLGIVIGAQLAGLPPAAKITNESLNTIGGWSPWVGVLFLGVGTYMFFSAPRGSLVWLLVVLYAAWVGEILGNLVFSAELSGFVGGLIVFPVAVAVQNVKQAPPAFVTFLPAFWLLVPGALGLAGVTQIVGYDRQAGVGDFIAAIVSIGAISLGVLTGATIVEWIRSRRGRDTVTGARLREL